MQCLALYALVIFMSEVWPTKKVRTGSWIMTTMGSRSTPSSSGSTGYLTFILVPVACAALQR